MLTNAVHGSDRVTIWLLFLVPAAHPLLMPWVGTPSHLLWWTHVLPVALLAYSLGRSAAVGSLVLSAFLVLVGEQLFGAGYGSPADPQTTWALVVALSATNILVGAFALRARKMTGRYRLLFDRVQMGVVRVEKDGRILTMNPAAGEILGWEDVDGLFGRPVDEVMKIPGVSSIRELAERGSWTGQLEIDGAAGPRRLHGLLAVTPLSDSSGYQILLADRSTEVMQEQEIERQAKLASLGEALAGVAHELNNPLAVILANAQLGLMEEDLAEDPREFFTVVSDQAMRMRSLIKELLGFSRQSDKDECASIEEVLDRFVRVQRIVLGKALRLDHEIEWRGEVRISATKLEQILLNLMSNAAYSVKTGGGSGITISTRYRDEHVEVEVRDDGPGIDPEILGDLFQPFATTKPEGSGTGLGLAISRRLARSWGGDLVARNVEPRGAAFTLMIPPAGPDFGVCAPPDDVLGAGVARPHAVEAAEIGPVGSLVLDG